MSSEQWSERGPEDDEQQAAQPERDPVNQALIDVTDQIQEADPELMMELRALRQDPGSIEQPSWLQSAGATEAQTIFELASEVLRDTEDTAALAASDRIAEALATPVRHAIGEQEDRAGMGRAVEATTRLSRSMATGEPDDFSEALRDLIDLKVEIDLRGERAESFVDRQKTEAAATAAWEQFSDRMPARAAPAEEDSPADEMMFASGSSLRGDDDDAAAKGAFRDGGASLERNIRALAAGLIGSNGYHASDLNAHESAALAGMTAARVTSPLRRAALENGDDPAAQQAAEQSDVLERQIASALRGADSERMHDALARLATHEANTLRSVAEDGYQAKTIPENANIWAALRQGTVVTAQDGTKAQHTPPQAQPAGREEAAPTGMATLQDALLSAQRYG